VYDDVVLMDSSFYSKGFGGNVDLDESCAVRSWQKKRRFLPPIRSCQLTNSTKLKFTQYTQLHQIIDLKH
jgi:hypothetical protein